MSLLQPQLLRDVYHSRFNVTTAILEKITKLQQQAAALFAALAAPAAAAAATGAAGVSCAAFNASRPPEPFVPPGEALQQQQQQRQHSHRIEGIGFGNGDGEAPEGAPLDPSVPGAPMAITSNLLQKRSAFKLGLMSLVEERAKDTPEGAVRV